MLRAPPATPLTTLFARLVLAAVSAARVSGISASSWFRTPEENARVGGTVGSFHTLGLAIDLVGDRLALDRVADIWRAIGLQAFDEGDHLHLELDSANGSLGAAIRRAA